ncbi:MAG: shikimate kinase [Acidobacteriota bacterium]
MKERPRIVLTGFMGVGKSSVGRHVAQMLGERRFDLDSIIEGDQDRSIAEIVDAETEAGFRVIETHHLANIIADDTVRILSLGGGAWTIPINRTMLREKGFTSVWLEATFEHCWLNIAFSRRDRPLARNKKRAIELFEERQKVYCLADWHFIVRPGSTSYDVAKQIKEELFS